LCSPHIKQITFNYFYNTTTIAITAPCLFSTLPTPPTLPTLPILQTIPPASLLEHAVMPPVLLLEHAVMPPVPLLPGCPSPQKKRLQTILMVLSWLLVSLKGQSLFRVGGYAGAALVDRV
jgi:hypothetical protein